MDGALLTWNAHAACLTGYHRSSIYKIVVFAWHRRDWATWYKSILTIKDGEFWNAWCWVVVQSKRILLNKNYNHWSFGEKNTRSRPLNNSPVTADSLLDRSRSTSRFSSKPLPTIGNSSSLLWEGYTYSACHTIVCFVPYGERGSGSLWQRQFPDSGSISWQFSHYLRLSFIQLNVRHRNRSMLPIGLERCDISHVTDNTFYIQLSMARVVADLLQRNAIGILHGRHVAFIWGHLFLVMVLLFKLILYSEGQPYANWYSHFDGPALVVLIAKWFKILSNDSFILLCFILFDPIL